MLLHAVGLALCAFNFIQCAAGKSHIANEFDNVEILDLSGPGRG
jgi:hypothetical protein